jgi:hypothetical protein
LLDVPFYLLGEPLFYVAYELQNENKGLLLASKKGNFSQCDEFFWYE